MTSSAPPAALRDLTLHAEIARSRPLPGHYYADPAWLPRERDAIFARAWNLVGWAEQFAEPGAYSSVTVAGEPIVIVRDADALRAYYNVCRHRGGPLTDGCGRQRQFTCRYHGWSYALDGRVLRAPHMAEELAAHRATLDLRPVQVARWANLVFVNLDPAAPGLVDSLGGLAEVAGPLALDRMRYVSSHTYTVAANWKVYVDNYLEGYHVPPVHPGLNREIDFRDYVTELGESWSYQHAPFARDAGGERLYAPRVAGDEARYYWLWPNIMLNIYQGLLQTNVVEPDGAERTRVRFDWFALEPPHDEPSRERTARMVAFSDEVQAEDAAICAAVQRNLGSRGFEPGPYSTRYETGVHQFHRLYADWMQR